MCRGVMEDGPRNFRENSVQKQHGMRSCWQPLQRERVDEWGDEVGMCVRMLRARRKTQPPYVYW